MVHFQWIILITISLNCVYARLIPVDVDTSVFIGNISSASLLVDFTAPPDCQGTNDPSDTFCSYNHVCRDCSRLQKRPRNVTPCNQCRTNEVCIEKGVVPYRFARCLDMAHIVTRTVTTIPNKQACSGATQEHLTSSRKDYAVANIKESNTFTPQSVETISFYNANNGLPQSYDGSAKDASKSTSHLFTLDIRNEFTVCVITQIPRSLTVYLTLNSFF